MLNRKFKALIAVLLIAMQSVALAAEEGKEQEVDPGTKAIMYIPDRIADAFDIVRFGLAFGPSFGAEVSITKYAQLGAYASYEGGAAWTGRSNPKLHCGPYWTSVIGPLRNEMDVESTNYFHRADWQIRAQVAAGLAHGYAGIDFIELGDFFAGLVCIDISKDDTTYGQNQLDKDYDTILGTTPMHRLGRGLSNLLFGFWEIPQNAMDATNDQGYAAGFTYGLLVRGIGHFVVREVTGVWEIITFPKGGKPIIEPEYPWMPHVEHPWNFEWN